MRSSVFLPHPQSLLTPSTSTSRRAAKAWRIRILSPPNLEVGVHEFMNGSPGRMHNGWLILLCFHPCSVAGMTPAADIYSFGMCALEMATLEIQGANGEAGSLVTEEHIQRAIEALEVPIQSDFIRACLRSEPGSRPTARGLLFHRALFEVSPLKLLAAHTVVRCSGAY